MIYLTSEHDSTPRIPDYSKVGASHCQSTPPNVPESLTPLSHIAATGESSVPVVNLIVGRLNQRKFTVTERESDVAPAKTWVRKDIVM